MILVIVVFEKDISRKNVLEYIFLWFTTKLIIKADFEKNENVDDEKLVNVLYGCKYTRKYFFFLGFSFYIFLRCYFYCNSCLKVK